MYQTTVLFIDGGQKVFNFDGWMDCELFTTDLRQGEYYAPEMISIVSTSVNCIVHGLTKCDSFGVCSKCWDEQDELMRQVEEDLWEAQEFASYQQMKADLRIQM